MGHQRRQTYMLFLHAVTILSVCLNYTLMHVFSSFLIVEGDEGEGRRGLAFRLLQKQKIIQRLSPKMFSLFSNNQVNHFSSQGKNSEKSVEKKS